MGVKSIFWLVVLTALFYVGFKIAPVFFKGTIGIRGVCKEQVDLYKKYGREYVSKRIDESLTEKGIPPDKRTYTIESDAGENRVTIRINYSDSVDFFGRYQKTFDFSYECEGKLRSIY